MAETKSKDTQWPTFLVFHQKAEGRPHMHAGSVHAPDSEMALMNARDVFVRRPSCSSLWVAPASQVYAKTRQELATLELPDPQGETEGLVSTYYIFKKNHQKGSCALSGEVEASAPEIALAMALEKYPPPDSLWWWVIPKSVISKTQAADQEPLFEPANRKVFRHQSSFNTLTLMRKITHDAAQIEEPDDEG